MLKSSELQKQNKDTSCSSAVIYLDYNATTPLASEVIKVISKTLEDGWGNPSSLHSLGKKAKSIIDESRINVSKMINAKSEDIIFTSGGTEANNMALYSAVQHTNKNRILKGLPHVITSNVEHDSVIKVLQNWVNSGIIELSIVPVNRENGCISLEKLIPLIKPETCLITIMHANNETGIIMPIEQIGNYLESIKSDRDKNEYRRILFHSDAAQTIGKIPVDIEKLKVDYLTIVGHKFYGPRIGALFVRNLGTMTPIHTIIHGGGQENGHRAGTENTPMIAGLGSAASLVSANISEYMNNMIKCREKFSKLLLEYTGLGFQINFSTSMSTGRLPNTVSVAVPPTLLASKILDKCDRLNASLGAACHSGTNLPSDILIASGLSIEEARRTIRFSMGRETTFEQIDLAIKIIVNECHQLLKLKN